MVGVHHAMSSIRMMMQTRMTQIALKTHDMMPTTSNPGVDSGNARRKVA